MQAAFVDIGYDLNAFLPFSEIGSDEYIIEDSGGKRSKNNKNFKYDNIEVDLKKDQEIYVQVIKEPFAGKGPRVTTEVALPRQCHLSCDSRTLSCKRFFDYLNIDLLIFL